MAKRTRKKKRLSLVKYKTLKAQLSAMKGNNNQIDLL